MHLPRPSHLRPQPGDADEILSLLEQTPPDRTDGWVTWQAATGRWHEAHGTYLPIERYWAAVDVLTGRGKLLRQDIAVKVAR